jgi:hypothetical protein
MDEFHVTPWDGSQDGLHGDPAGLQQDLLQPDPMGYPAGSCAVVAEGTAINHLANADLTVDDYAGLLHDYGGYDPSNGTHVNDIGNFSADVGLSREETHDQTLADVQAHLDKGDVPIVAVDSSELFAAGPDHSMSDVINDFFGNSSLSGCDHVTLVGGTIDHGNGVEFAVVSDFNTPAIDPTITGPISVGADQFRDAMADCGGDVTYIEDHAGSHSEEPSGPSSFWDMVMPGGNVARTDSSAGSDTNNGSGGAVWDDIVIAFSGTSDNSASWDSGPSTSIFDSPASSSASSFLDSISDSFGSSHSDDSFSVSHDLGPSFADVSSSSTSSDSSSSSNE